MRLLVVGLSHRTAPLDLRERMALGAEDLAPALAALDAVPGVGEHLVLSTCNRTEIWAVAGDEAPGIADRIVEVLTGLRDVPRPMVDRALYLHEDGEAAVHALRVAAGLDSMIVGEEQILGQIRRAFEAARARGYTGPILNRLCQTAITTGRRVRRETTLARYAPSVPRAALALARQVLGDLAGRRVAVVGAGKIAAVVLQVFSAAGAEVDAVANRTLEAASALAARFGARGVGLDAVPDLASRVDALVACVGAARPVITGAMLAPAHARLTPLLVVDLGIPRGVDAAAGVAPGVVLYTLDDLGDGAGPVSAEDLRRAEEIIAAAAQTFEQWMTARAAAPLIAALQSRAGAIADGEFARADRRLRTLAPEQRAAVRALLDATVRKLLHGPTVRLRESAMRRDRRTLEAARVLFDLEAEMPAGTADDGEDAR